MRKLLIVMPLSLFVYACADKPLPAAPIAAETKIETPFIAPPIKALDPKFDTLTFDAQKGLRKMLKSGTRITIPADAFADKNGNILRGSVAVRYREFQTATEVFLAGIPMNYRNGHFTTAGSFELRPENADTKLLKSVEVRLASATAGNDFSFFRLNETDRRWDSLGYEKPEIVKKQYVQKIVSQKVVQPKEYFVFNPMALLDVWTNDNWAIIGDARKSDSVLTALQPRIDAYNLGFENLWVSSRTWVKWQETEFPAALTVWRNVEKKVFPNWASTTTKLERIDDLNYICRIKNDSTDALFEAKIAVKMPLKYLLAFTPESWQKNEAQNMASIRAEQERIRTTTQIYRTFSVNNFGLYNWDKLMKEDNNVVLNADFKFPTAFNEQLGVPDIVFISGDNRSVITFPKAQWQNLGLVPDKGGRLFAVLTNGKLAIFDKNEYANLNFAALRQTPQYAFILKDKGAINSEKDLCQKLGIN